MKAAIRSAGDGATTAADAVADRVARHARVSPGATGDDYHGVGVGVWHADPGDHGDRGDRGDRAALWSLRKLAGYLAGRDWPVRIGRERAAKVEGPLSQRVAQFERSESWTGSRWLRHPDLCRKENQQRSRW